MIALRRRLGVAAALIAVLMGLGLAAAGSSEAASGPLTLSAASETMLAQGGRTTITVRLPSQFVGVDGLRGVTLTTELGGFAAASGPNRLVATLEPSANDPQVLETQADLFGDGRAGASTVTAQLGTYVDTMAIRFVGPPAMLELRHPTAGRPLDASRGQRIEVQAVDRDGYGVLGTQIRLELLSSDNNARLEAAGSATAAARLTLSANRNGVAAATLRAEPGRVRLRIASGEVSLIEEIELHGPPTQLRLVNLGGTAVEAGTSSPTGSLAAVLTDAAGRATPSQRVTFGIQTGGGRIVADGEGESFTTDASGRAWAHLNAAGATPGVYRATARWSQGETVLSDAEAIVLSDAVEIVVSGPPSAIYLTAEALPQPVTLDPTSAPIEETRYRVTAEVVDALGNPVADGYEVRWRPLTSGRRAFSSLDVGVVRDGQLTAIFTLEHEFEDVGESLEAVDGQISDGSAARGPIMGDGPDLDGTRVQVWVIDAPEVGNEGSVADLTGTGLALSAGVNAVTWTGPVQRASEAFAPLNHVLESVWRWSAEELRWQAWFTEAVPGRRDFELQPGDRIFVHLQSAARLANIER